MNRTPSYLTGRIRSRYKIKVLLHMVKFKGQFYCARRVICVYGEFGSTPEVDLRAAISPFRYVLRVRIKLRVVPERNPQRKKRLRQYVGQTFSYRAVQKTRKNFFGTNGPFSCGRSHIDILIGLTCICVCVRVCVTDTDTVNVHVIHLVCTFLVHTWYVCIYTSIENVMYIMCMCIYTYNVNSCCTYTRTLT